MVWKDQLLQHCMEHVLAMRLVFLIWTYWSSGVLHCMAAIGSVAGLEQMMMQATPVSTFLTLLLCCAAHALQLQRCLARMVVWKDQLLQHCMEHESAMRQYCVEVDSAMSQQEQRLLGQAANNLQQRDAALIALHRVEDEVLHLKAVIAVRSASGRKEVKEQCLCR